MPLATRLSSLVFAALLVGTGCGDDSEADGGPCQSQRRAVRITGSIELGTQDKSLATHQGAQVLLAVDEDSSVVRCGDGLVTESTPGQTIGREILDAPGDFDFEVERTVYEFTTNSLWLRGLLDLNANGVCDEGELTGSAPLDTIDGSDGERVVLRAMVLQDEGCPARL